MRIIIPFSVFKKLYKSPENGEVMGIIHSNNNLLYDRVLLSHDEENNSAHNQCKIDDIVVGAVSFHTHPKVCYEIYKTNVGWPSLDDFTAFLSEKKMKVLIVVSMEGIYMIIKKKKIHSDLIPNIKNHYKFKIDKKKTTIDQYIEQTNKVCSDCITVIFFTTEKIKEESKDSNIKFDVVD